MLHHERWDGRGYPLKMKGNEIPIIARIIAVADTYDAMTSDRSYRRALPHEVAMAEIERCSATQFDPEVAATFTEHIDGYREEERGRGHKVLLVGVQSPNALAIRSYKGAGFEPYALTMRRYL